jgi:hypothetical protein
MMLVIGANICHFLPAAAAGRKKTTAAAVKNRPAASQK